MRMMRIRQANAIASLWAFAEATVFIIVPDVLLSWLALRSFKRGLIACLFALLVSLIGGATMWLWAKNNPDSARAIVESLPAISRAMISKRSTADCGVRTYSPLPGTSRGYSLQDLRCGSRRPELWACDLPRDQHPGPAESLRAGDDCGRSSEPGVTPAIFTTHRADDPCFLLGRLLHLVLLGDRKLITGTPALVSRKCRLARIYNSAAT